MSEQDEVIVPRFWVVGHEDTEYWHKDIVKAAGRLMQVDIWDENLRVYNCSLTPSAEMWYAGHITRDRVNDELDGDIRSAEHYSVDYENWSTVHRTKLKVLYGGNDTKEEWLARLEEHDGDREVAYRELVDEILEDLSANGLLECELTSIAEWEPGSACLVEEDNTMSGLTRLTCYGCEETLVRQPYMSDQEWLAAANEFRAKHGGEK